MSVEAGPRAGALRRRLTARLDRAFTEGGRSGTAALDARILLAHALGVAPSAIALRDDDPVDGATEARALSFIDRRIAGEPVARIVGRQAFWGLDLQIGPETLVPRPDTETVVEAALALLDRTGRRGEALRLLDIGTGSGAILLALLSELPAASGVATDIERRALAVAAANVRRLGLSDRVQLVPCDWASAVDDVFDLVLANPPYVESDAISGLQVEIRAFDPHIALNGGSDGFAAYRAILSDLDRLLAPRGRSFLEVGFGQAPNVAALAERCGFSADIHRDLAGVERVVEISRREDG